MMVEAIDNFERAPFRFLSNFYPAEVEFEGVVYPTLEHAYQAAKTFDLEDRERVRRAESPAAAKKLGRRVKARPDWDTAKIGVMLCLLIDKFRLGTFLATELLATDDAFLEEGNWWGDRFWGVCDGVGKNMLGILLMGVREALKQTLRAEYIAAALLE